MSVRYLRKYLKRAYGDNKRKQYIYALTLFTLFVENVSLFSQFYVIMWFNRYKNVLKDTSQQVQYTRNEEALHAQVGIKIINTLRDELPELFDEELEQRIYDETLEALNAESNVIDWMIGDYADENISADILKMYVANRLNKSLEAIGYKPVFEIDEALLAKSFWMDEETLGNTMTDFFHKRPVEYAKNNKSYNEEDLF
jgi:ribonucleoside-diphosphate reductase beta chain